MNKCVYVHVLTCDAIVAEKQRRNGDIVYVGSGSIYRSKEKAGRSSEHVAFWEHLESKIIAENLTVAKARELEQKLISENYDLGLFNRARVVPPRYDYNFEELSKYFFLDSDFTLKWKIDRYSGRGYKRLSAKAGHVAGHVHKSTGYLCVCLNSVLLQGHRIIYCLHNKTDISSDLVVDHQDNNPLNNHPLNLVLKTYSQNNLNRGKMKVSKTGVRGITRDKNKIVVAWYENGKRIMKRFHLRPHLKLGLTTEEAVECAMKEAIVFNKQIREKVYGVFDLNKSSVPD